MKTQLPVFGHVQKVLRRRLGRWRRALHEWRRARRVSRWRAVARASGKLVIGVTGSIGKTTTCQMLAHILAARYPGVALSTTQGAWIGRERVHSGDSACGWRALSLLADPRSEAAVCEIARGGLIKWGMELDALRIGLVLNVLDNHLGLDGIHTRADMARVKRAVVEKATHLAILNADDPLCLGMRPGLRAAHIALVSMDATNPTVLRHAEEGGLCGILDGRRLVLRVGCRTLGTMDIGEIPATFGGRFMPAVVNALFAMTAAHGAGLDFHTIRARLGTFASTPESNPGRMNFIAGLPFDLWLTWADGPQASAAVAKFFGGVEATGRKRVMLSCAGNRPDDYVMDMAAAFAPFFDEFLCIDRDDLRGRQPLEAARLLARGLERGGVNVGRIEVSGDPERALCRAFDLSAPGDLLLVVTLDSERVLQWLAQYRTLAEPSPRLLDTRRARACSGSAEDLGYAASSER